MGNGINISKDAFLNTGGNDLNARRDNQREMLFDGIVGIDRKLTEYIENATCPNDQSVKWLTWAVRIIIVSIAGGFFWMIRK